MTLLNVLIIDDHQLIIEILKKALTLVQNDLGNINFNVDEAKCCNSAHNKMMKESKLGNIDLFFLDISLPSSIHNIHSGEDLGVKIRAHFPMAKVIVCTSFNTNLRLKHIIKTINPDSLIVKDDIDFKDTTQAIKAVLNNETYYSQTVITLLRKNASSSIILSEFDVQILKEISNGARMKELVELIPLSKASIEKRKRKLKLLFNIKKDSDRVLVLKAKAEGFI